MLPELLPYFLSAEKASDYFENQRWPTGVLCPYCGSEQVEKRERSEQGFQRYNCPNCAQTKGQEYRMFTVWTNSIYEGSKLSPSIWLWVIAMWQLKLNSTEIALAVGVNVQIATRCVNLLDGSMYESHHLDPERQLSGEVEADECYQTAGHKGQPEWFRKNALLGNGFSNAEVGSPPSKVVLPS